MGKWILIIMLLLGAGAYQHRESIDLWLNPPDYRNKGQGNVILYSTKTCGYCKLTREYFAEHDIEYIDYDVNNSDKGRRQFIALRGQGVPVVRIGSEVIHGFNLQRVERALNRVLPPERAIR